MFLPLCNKISWSKHCKKSLHAFHYLHRIYLFKWNPSMMNGIVLHHSFTLGFFILNSWRNSTSLYFVVYHWTFTINFEMYTERHNPCIDRPPQNNRKKKCNKKFENVFSQLYLLAIKTSLNLLRFILQKVANRICRCLWITSGDLPCNLFIFVSKIEKYSF